MIIAGRGTGAAARWAMILLAVMVLVAAACSNDDDTSADEPPDVDALDLSAGAEREDDDPRPDFEGEAPEFSGDPDSPYCALVAESARRPVADPFESGIDAREFELRLRNMRSRMAEFVNVSPPELTDDLASLVDAIDEVVAAAAPHDYDLGAMAASGDAIEVLDDPALAVVAARLEIYNLQVCARSGSDPDRNDSDADG